MATKPRTQRAVRGSSQGPIGWFNSHCLEFSGNIDVLRKHNGFAMTNASSVYMMKGWLEFLPSCWHRAISCIPIHLGHQRSTSTAYIPHSLWHLSRVFCQLYNEKMRKTFLTKPNKQNFQYSSPSFFHF